jgi:hypothetical protein
MSTLEERVASLEQVIAEYERDLRNATSEERKDRLLDVIKANRDNLTTLLNENIRAKQLAQYFQYSCHVIRGRTRRKFRANLFRLAELYSGYTRENTSTDGITKDGKNIIISLIFKTEGDFKAKSLNLFPWVKDH